MAPPREVPKPPETEVPYGEKKDLPGKGVGSATIIYSPEGVFEWQIGKKLKFQVQILDGYNDSSYSWVSAPGKYTTEGFTPIPGLTRHHVKNSDITPLYYDFAGWKPSPYTINLVSYDQNKHPYTDNGAIVILKN